MITQSATDVIMGAGHPLYSNDGIKLSGDLNYDYVGGSSIWNGLISGTIGGDADGDNLADPWTLIQDKGEFQKLAWGDTPKRVIGIAQANTTLQERRWFRPSGNSTEPPYTIALNRNVPTLEMMAKAAINVLDNDPDGYFLMIEGGAVDMANEDNVLGRSVFYRNQYLSAGEQSVSVILTGHQSPIGSGAYFLRLHYEGIQYTQKIALLK